MLRKGQHLFNELMKKHHFTSWQVLDDKAVRQIGKAPDRKPPTVFLDIELHQVLFYISDDEFDKIMSTLPKEKIDEKQSTIEGHKDFLFQKRDS